LCGPVGARVLEWRPDGDVALAVAVHVPHCHELHTLWAHRPPRCPRRPKHPSSQCSTSALRTDVLLSRVVIPVCLEMGASCPLSAASEVSDYGSGDQNLAEVSGADGFGAD